MSSQKIFLHRRRDSEILSSSIPNTSDENNERGVLATKHDVIDDKQRIIKCAHYYSNVLNVFFLLFFFFVSVLREQILQQQHQELYRSQRCNIIFIIIIDESVFENKDLY
jgi:hypothetical protein